MLGVFNVGLVGRLLRLLGRWVGTSWVALILFSQRRHIFYGDFFRVGYLNLRQIGHVVLIVSAHVPRHLYPHDLLHVERDW